MGTHNRREFLGWLAACGVGVTALSGDAPHTAGNVDAADAIVLSGVSLIDGTGAPARAGCTLVLANGRIVSAGVPAQPPPAGIRTVDLRGKYVIPGLWDMHTHSSTEDDIVLPLHIANGVTSVREMWGFPQTLATRDRIDSGDLLGPRMTIAGSIIDGWPSVWPQATQVVTAEEARVAVRRAAAEGFDFVKVYSNLGPQPYWAVVDEARKAGLTVTGHQPARVRLSDVADAGMRSFEHLLGMPTATSTMEDEILLRLNQFTAEQADARSFYTLLYGLEWQAVQRHSPEKAAALYDRLARKGCWQTPTLTVNRVYSVPAETFADDPRLKYVSAAIRNYWAATMAGAPASPEVVAQQREYFEFRLAMVGQMERAGVPILGGTDTPNPYVFPGFAVHDELELLVQAGLSPMRALQTMTRDAARFLGLEATMGTIERGKVADLVVLDANPLDDISNTQRIHAVVTRGRFIDSAQRAQILAEVERAADPTGAGEPTVRPALRGCGCHGNDLHSPPGGG